MAKPNKRLPTRTVDIRCSGCKYKLFKYHKGGKGSLIKCFIERISVDYTHEEGVCPGCGVQFAKRELIRGAPALKIIGNKAMQK